MCGIVGGVTNSNIVPLLLEGLNRLEYRGYDSSGLIVLSENNTFQSSQFFLSQWYENVVIVIAIINLIWWIYLIKLKYSTISNLAI